MCPEPISLRRAAAAMAAGCCGAVDAPSMCLALAGAKVAGWVDMAAAGRGSHVPARPPVSME